jgi:hypothetical protein
MKRKLEMDDAKPSIVSLTPGSVKEAAVWPSHFTHCCCTKIEQRCEAGVAVIICFNIM